MDNSHTLPTPNKEQVADITLNFYDNIGTFTYFKQTN